MGDDVVTISTVIPTRNRPDLLMERAIPSVLAQTLSDWECIVVGDGTDAETARRMGDLVARDPRFRFFNLRHTEIDDPLEAWRASGAHAFAFGVARARGEWIAYLADDDRFRPRHHETLLAHAEGADIVFGQSLVCLSTGAQTDRVFGTRIAADDITQGSYIARRGVDLSVEVRADRAWDGIFWDRLIASGVRFRMVPAIVHEYFAAPENIAFHQLPVR